jgi:cyclase
LRIRVIPCLLIYKGGLVKSVKFKDYKYVGDPINAVKIFNEKEVDEIAILDISATSEKRSPFLSQITEIASEAFMPLSYGGGVTTIEQIKDIFYAGVEKVILNTSAFKNTKLINEAASLFGNQSVVVSMDVKNALLRGSRVYIENGKTNTGLTPVQYAKMMQDAGAGEIILNSIDRDGTFTGYDYKLISEVSKTIEIPLVALGGASNTMDFKKAIKNGASAVAAGSMFVFQGPHRAVLISYPSQTELKEIIYTK